MKHRFEAIIKKAGINPYVDVPPTVTATMQATKGYIYINGKINKHAFTQTLVPVKNSGYRLYVNGPMMKGAIVKVGDTATFTIEQTAAPEPVPMLPVFKKKLVANKLLSTFEAFSPSRQKEVLRYLNNLKTEESVNRNIEKFIALIKKGESPFR